jgi:hypothetical protein
MKSVTYLLSILLCGLLFNSTVIAQDNEDTVSLESLLTEMINREALARYPNPYYTTRQFSSYDRNATESGTQNWFANWDRTQFIRVEENQGRKEYVMMDSEGPGAIVRFWMTFAGEGAGQGTLRIYFDGEKEPTIEGTAFYVLSGGALVGMPLSMSVSPKTNYERRGHNLYLPLPYAKHCKITYQSENITNTGAKDGGESVYYNINYRDYESSTDVTTFSKAQLEENKQLFRQVQEQLLFRDKDYQLSQLDIQNETFSKTLKGDESYDFGIEGPAAVRKLSLKLDAENENQALRSIIIKISFDGEQTVWTPVGDFFGTGYQYRDSNTWYTTVSENGNMNAYWVMPFRDQARITLLNLGEQDVSISKGSITYSDWTWDNSSMYFGADWHQYSDLYTGERKSMEGEGNPFDINYTQLKGSGVYVGDVITLFNTSYAWWGEGDEKIYIDGEDFPSHFGTGTEDYYGYAWVRPEVFTNHPFISQPDGSGNITPGYTVNMRFRALDAIPFQDQLTVDMEMWHWVSTAINFAPTTFYYLKSGGESLIQPDRENAKKEVALHRRDLISPIIKDNRIEGENLIVDSYSSGAISFQYLEEPKLSNDKQLWWREGSEGDSLKATFISDEAGTFTATANFVVAPDYGIVNFLINGQTVLEDFNAYHDSVSTRKVELGEVRLDQGENEIRVTLQGEVNELNKAFFGLDYIDFLPNN